MAGFASHTPVRAIVPLIAAAMLGVVLLTWVLTSFTDSTTQLADASTTSVSLVAQYMLDRRWIEDWFVRIGFDVIQVGLYAVKGLWITGALYLLFSPSASAATTPGADTARSSPGRWARRRCRAHSGHGSQTLSVVSGSVLHQHQGARVRNQLDGSHVKFDLILTNPPFQDTVNRNKTPHKLWIDFTLAVFDRLIAEGGSLVQVSPASFGSPSNIVLRLMEENQTNVLRFATEAHFPDVGSTFSDYWIEKRDNTERPTRVIKGLDDFEIELDRSMAYLPNDLGRISLSVHKKVMFAGLPKLAVEWDYVACHNIRRKDPNPTLVEKKDEAHPFPVFHTNNIQWWTSIRQEWADEKKVLWTRSGYTKPFYDPGRLGGTDMAYYVRVLDEGAGQALAHNLNTQVMRYIYKTAKWSGFGNERVFAGLPQLPTDRELDEQEAFDYFGLTGEEAEYVKLALAPRRSKVV